MKNILHITTHMGGGIGNTLSAMCIGNKNNRKYRHSILCLEATEKRQYLDLCISSKVDLTISDDIYIIEEKIKQADIVQISWWHHPKMAKLLAEFPRKPTRLIIWSHISGCNYPSVPFAFLQKAHRVFFTSRYSYDNPNFNEGQRRYLEKNSDLIYGSGNLCDMTVRCKRGKKNTFNIGYVGTLEYSKLYPDFIRLCSKINIPDIKFIMVGDNSQNKDMLLEIEKYNMTEKFEFRGYTTDVFSELMTFDVFGYPLNPKHFGTTENAILEAMIAQIPVVTFNQNAEKYIIQNGETGLLADNEEAYVELIKYLYDNPGERDRIGVNANKYVLDEFSTSKKMNTLEHAYENVLRDAPRIFEFQTVFGSKPHEWFLSCLGDDYSIFKDAVDTYRQSDYGRKQGCEKSVRACSEILKVKTKSSVQHFHQYYAEDEVIAYLNGVLNDDFHSYR